MTTNNNQVTIEIENVETNKTETIVETNTEPNAFQKIYNSSLETLKTKVQGIKIRSSTLHLIIKYVMEEVENTPIKGSEQKNMALELIRALVIDLTEKEDEEALLKMLDDGTISNMIDLIVDATRGKLNINAITKTTSGCINSCIPYWFSNKK